MMKLFLVFLAAALFSCSYFFEKETTIRLINDSPYNYDSLVISSPLNHTVIKALQPGAIMSTTFTITESKDEGSFVINAYRRDSETTSLSFGYFESATDIDDKYEFVIEKDGTIKSAQ